MNTTQGGWSTLPSESERAAHNRKVLVGLVAGGVLFALVVAVCVGLVARDLGRDVVGKPKAVQNASQVPVADQLPLAPPGVTGNGAVRVGDPGAKVVVRVVADLQCPACQMFEKANAKVLEDAVNSGSVLVEYNVISFLDRASTTQYSSRAGNASYCVAESDPARYQSWLASMFDQQPAEGGDGLPDERLIEIARDAGYADPAVAQCITERKYDPFLRAKTKENLAGGIKSTPSVFVNGQQVTDPQQLFGAEGLTPALAAAR
ncbi:protein-disulfide isomerase [Nocardia tenerifensis]|uniref:Protein-disulfide isomerase n=1 Tax=Nocardia tenerifensis TaxID=228006 RepID=A0A318JW72_9NOCA|nr:thioredoxin domain-containing protein [Nocardia tenerifensis]PXX58739.1 protein-disulfide isomerase [Nocardia tenerifensis]